MELRRKQVTENAYVIRMKKQKLGGANGKFVPSMTFPRWEKRSSFSLSYPLNDISQKSTIDSQKFIPAI